MTALSRFQPDQHQPPEHHPGDPWQAGTLPGRGRGVICIEPECGLFARTLDGLRQHDCRPAQDRRLLQQMTRTQKHPDGPWSPPTDLGDSVRAEPHRRS